MRPCKTLFVTLIALFLIFSQLQVFQAVCVQLVEVKQVKQVNSSSTIYVPDDYPTIQEAINAASPGDTIIVREGTYYENLVVNVSGIVLRSEMGAEKTIIDGNFTGTVVEISANNVTIEGFTIKGSGLNAFGLSVISSNNTTIHGNNIIINYYGIFLQNSSNNTIYGNIIASNNEYGIYLHDSSNNTIYGNNITYNAWGICLDHSSNNAIYGNNIENSIDYFGQAGIFLQNSSDNAIYGNNITNNFYSIALWGSGSSGNNVSFNNILVGGLIVYDSYENVVEGNLVNGKPLVYLEDAANVEVADAGQVIAVNSRNITVRNLEISNTTIAIEFWNTNESKIVNCNLASNHIGIFLQNSSNNAIYGNNIANSYGGIGLLWSDGNVVYLNNFIGNDEHVYLSFSVNNVWSSPSPLNYTYNDANFTGYLGNYWDDYAGSDSDGDGVGDTPYQIDSENVDNYPLMEPVENYVFDVTPPTLQVESPVNNSFVRGTVNISVSAHDQYGVSKVEFYIDGELVATDNAAPYTWNWNTATSSDGAHTIEIKVYDAFNNVNSTKIIVNVDNTPPNISAVEYPSEVEENVTVKINVTVTDVGSGVDEVILSYSVDGGETWVNLTAAAKIGDVYEAVVPGQTAGTTVQFKVVAVDEAGNVAVSQTYSYEVVSEEQPPEEETPPGVSWTLIGGVAVIAVVVVAAAVNIIRRRS